MKLKLMIIIGAIMMIGGNSYGAAPHIMPIMPIRDMSRANRGDYIAHNLTVGACFDYVGAAFHANRNISAVDLFNALVARYGIGDADIIERQNLIRVINRKLNRLHNAIAGADRRGREVLLGVQIIQVIIKLGLQLIQVIIKRGGLLAAQPHLRSRTFVMVNTECAFYV